jgi:hypothetical protein
MPTNTPRDRSANIIFDLFICLGLFILFSGFNSQIVFPYLRLTGHFLSRHWNTDNIAPLADAGVEG